MAKTLSKEEAKDQLFWLQQMVEIRAFEERCSMEYGLRNIGGFLHLYIGQEAVAVGSVSCLDLKTDYVYTAYRDHAHSMAMGMDPKALMAEMFGKITGCSKGKGGSMHFFDAEKHMMGGNGIIGAQTPLATGTALKIRYKEEDGVVLCFFGDGAIHQGALYESMNLAKVWQLPIIFICENNQYGMGTHFHRVSATHDFTKIAGAFEMPGEAVDGMDILEVRRVMGHAIERARTEHMPSLIEAKTYRYVGHSISDPQKYRGKDEVQEKKEVDPIKLHKDRLISAGVLTEEEFKAMQVAARNMAADSVKFAQESPEPELSEIYTDVLV